MPAFFWQQLARRQRSARRLAESRGLYDKKRRPPQVPAIEGSHESADDCEAPLRQLRMHTEGTHGAPCCGASQSETEDLMTSTASESNQARMRIQTPAERDRDSEKQEEAVRSIVQAQDNVELFLVMKTLIEEDWLGGFEGLPGNIYRIAAFQPVLPKHEFARVTRRIGFTIIVSIQLFGPPLLFFQKVKGSSTKEHEQFHWDLFQGFSLSDWTTGFWSTKLMSLLFLICFCLNGLFVHMDEAISWRKIDKLWRELNHFCRLKNGSETYLKFGAFMNMWVIFWLCLDVFLVLGASEDIKDVLLDSIGLMFLYNLDDISGDLGFVNLDDWPGEELAWLSVHIQRYSEELDEVEEFNPDPCCNFFLQTWSILLTFFTIALPIFFTFTPFKELMPDPFFERLIKPSDLKTLMKGQNFV